MSLTLGTGPLAGSRSTAALNFSLEAAPAHRIAFQPDPRRLRALVGDTVVLDTVRAHLLHETAILPRIYAPLEDYRADALVPTQTTTHCPFKGDATYWTVRAQDGREVVDGLWGYAEPTAAAPFLRGFASLYEDKVDAWFVEEDRVLGHLRDPYHRVDAHASAREVVVTVAGEEVARSARPILVFETGLPVRAYVPPADVRPGAVSAGSGQRSVCPYKGEASYWTVAGLEDAAWSYESPLPDALRAQGHFCFDDARDEVEVTIA